MIKVSKILTRKRTAAQIELGDSWQKPQQRVAPVEDAYSLDRGVKKQNAQDQRVQKNQQTKEQLSAAELEAQRKQQLAATTADFLKTVNTGGHTLKDLITNPNLNQFRARIIAELRSTLEKTGLYQPKVDNVPELVRRVTGHRLSRMIRVSRVFNF